MYKMYRFYSVGDLDPVPEILTGSDPKGANYQSEKVIFSHHHFQYWYLSFSTNHEKKLKVITT
jgi:hypothetical protein